VWIVAADSAFERVKLTKFAPTGLTVEIDPAVNITDGGPDDVRAGDLLMFTKGSVSVLVQVTGVSGQELSFDTGDSMNLNQNAALNGTLRTLRDIARPTTTRLPAVHVSTEATRIRMNTYYIDALTIRDARGSCGA
jgi:hypothetical protein